MKLFSRSSPSGSSGENSPVQSPVGSPKHMVIVAPPSARKPLDATWYEEGYELVAKLGEGSNANVYLAYHDGQKDTAPVAIKRVAYTLDETRRHAEAEILALRALGSHPNLVALARYYITEDNNYICLVMPYYSCDLLGYLRNEAKHGEAINWDVRRQVFRGMVEALFFMHANQFAHLDVKLENVLLDLTGPRAVLCDLGFSRHVVPAHTPQTLWHGSEHYSCPQILSRTPYVAAKADVWSLGVCLYAMLYGSLPWGDPRRNFDAILAGRYRQPDCYAPSHAVHLLPRLLCVDELHRASISEVKTNYWFQAA